MYEIRSEISKRKCIVKHHERLGEIEIAIITDDIACEILVALANKSLRLAEACPTPGETVRVVNGPFMNFTGIVESRDLDKFEATVNLDIFGKTTSVALGFSRLETVMGAKS